MLQEIIYRLTTLSRELSTDQRLVLITCCNKNCRIAIFERERKLELGERLGEIRRNISFLGVYNYASYTPIYTLKSIHTCIDIYNLYNIKSLNH